MRTYLIIGRPNYQRLFVCKSIAVTLLTELHSKRKHYSMLVISASQKSPLMSLHWQPREGMCKQLSLSITLIDWCVYINERPF